MDDQRNKFFSALRILDDPAPPVLYHYTSMEALLSIIKSGRMRASHIRYLNDLSEAEWMWGIAVRELEKMQSFLETESGSPATRILELIDKRRSGNEFVASFSEKGDDLSQWRAYCPSGAGFSIGFDSAALATQWVADPHGGDPAFVDGRLQKVTYLGPEEFKFSTDLSTLIDVCGPIVIEKGLDGKPVTKEQFILSWLSTISPSFKHPAFRAEAEWGLVLNKPQARMPFQQFRAGRSAIIPYVDAILNRSFQSKQPAKYLVKRVTIGPTPSPELSRASLGAVFETLGHSDVEIEISSIPFRNW